MWVSVDKIVADINEVWKCDIFTLTMNEEYCEEEDKPEMVYNIYCGAICVLANSYYQVSDTRREQMKEFMELNDGLLKNELIEVNLNKLGL